MKSDKKKDGKMNHYTTTMDNKDWIGNQRSRGMFLACWLVKSAVEICVVTDGVSMFILPMFLSGIFFDFSLFSHSGSYVDICNIIVSPNKPA